MAARLHSDRCIQPPWFEQVVARQRHGCRRKKYQLLAAGGQTRLGYSAQTLRDRVRGRCIFASNLAGVSQRIWPAIRMNLAGVSHLIWPGFRMNLAALDPSIA